MPLTERDYDLLSLYVDDALPPPERHALEARLAAEDGLRVELEALRRTIALVKSLPEMVAPRDLRLTSEIAASVLAELQAAQPAVIRPRRPVTHLLTSFAAAAASLVLVLAGALTLLQPEMMPSPVMSAESAATVAVADVMLSDVPPAGTPTLKTDDDATAGVFALPDIVPSDATETAMPMSEIMMMEEVETSEDSTFFSIVPSPLLTQSIQSPADETPDAAGGLAAFMSATMEHPSGNAAESTLTATKEAGAADMMRAQPPAAPLPAKTAAPDTAMAEMSIPSPTLSTESAEEVIETVVAAAGAGDTVETELQESVNAPPVTAASAPITGFVLVIAGLTLGALTLILTARKGPF